MKYQINNLWSALLLSPQKTFVVFIVILNSSLIFDTFSSCFFFWILLEHFDLKSFTFKKKKYDCKIQKKKTRGKSIKNKRRIQNNYKDYEGFLR